MKMSFKEQDQVITSTTLISCINHYPPLHSIRQYIYWKIQSYLILGNDNTPPRCSVTHVKWILSLRLQFLRTIFTFLAWTFFKNLASEVNVEANLQTGKYHIVLPCFNDLLVTPVIPGTRPPLRIWTRKCC